MRSFVNRIKALAVVFCSALLTLLPQHSWSESWGDNVSDSYVDGRYIDFKDEDRANVRLNHFFQYGVHNTYHVENTLWDVLKNHNNNIELDIRPEFTANDGTSKKVYTSNKDWVVSHDSSSKTPTPTCRDDKTKSFMFTECLGIIKRFHDQYPKHDLITVFIEPKNNWSESHNPALLDSVLMNYFTKNSSLVDSELFMPEHMGPSPRKSAAAGNWPTVAELEGKIRFVLANDRHAQLNEYLNLSSQKVLWPLYAIFSSYTDSDIDDVPAMEPQNKDYVVLYNSVDGKKHLMHELGPKVFKRNFVTRVVNVPFDELQSSHKMDLIQFIDSQKVTGVSWYTGYSSKP